MIEPPHAPPPPARGRRAGWWLALALALLAALAAWAWWSAREQARLAGDRGVDQRVEALEARTGRLRDDLRAQAQRLQQAEATNRVLRDELLGLGQRAAIVEDDLAALAAPRRDAAQALRLDEVELLLAQGEQRLQLAGDLDGARRAYALAAQLLSGLDHPAPGLLDLRQALAQERAALDVLGEDPRRIAAGRLEALAAALPALPVDTPAGDAPAASWWQRAFGRLVEVRPTEGAVALEPADRAGGLAALQLELTLARAAIERRDEAGLRAALERIDAWLTRLWPDSPALRERRAGIAALRKAPLSVPLPVLGTTLDQLRRQRAGSPEGALAGRES
ncbi:uroporphyrinogen-III C-methyltransferase [Luteimonas sp. RD2P54]|uniref:Uroporphyrinogen-III C-methyltransferase n=1 Tax=Luteimonas endophytica TaxID=3042023 RepID=A0ABT6J925_9GAMM|nr:uroporphyrinogen-III C-methyltransferase [Luteimonas endophytica]MDH5823306.1 uroporphyrinogen-III C-methyltransferase [Luteimonas endophytica]